jgi:hypothetical protein
MILHRVRGRILSVLATELDPSINDVQLRVIIDQKPLDPANIRLADHAAGNRAWSVHLPPELRDEHPHRIELEISSEGRLIDDAEFSFAASYRIVDRSDTAPPS